MPSSQRGGICCGHERTQRFGFALLSLSRPQHCLITGNGLIKPQTFAIRFFLNAPGHAGARRLKGRQHVIGEFGAGLLPFGTIDGKVLRVLLAARLADRRDRQAERPGFQIERAVRGGPQRIFGIHVRDFGGYLRNFRAARPIPVPEQSSTSGFLLGPNVAIDCCEQP